MSNSENQNGKCSEQTARLPEDRLVYIVPEHSIARAADDEVSVGELWDVIWRGKWLIAAITSIFATGSVVLALAQTEWYRAEVVMVPAEQQSVSSIANQLGGLAALAGVRVGGGGGAEPLGVLRSREFARAFIDERMLLPILFVDHWDPVKKQWLAGDPSDRPDIRDGVIFFQERVLHVSEDPRSGLVTLAVEWRDPALAAEWANELARRLNAKLRERTLSDAEANVAYLRGELANTTMVTLQESIGRLLESELQKLMLARGNEEFAFRVIDSAETPKYRVRPKRTLTVIIGTMLGALLGVFAVFVLRAVRSRPA